MRADRRGRVVAGSVHSASRRKEIEAQKQQSGDSKAVVGWAAIESGCGHVVGRGAAMLFPMRFRRFGLRNLWVFIVFLNSKFEL